MASGLSLAEGLGDLVPLEGDRVPAEAKGHRDESPSDGFSAAHVSARERTTRSPSSATDPMMSPVITISTVSSAMCTGWTITS